jgi:hypothetical protein
MLAYLMLFFILFLTIVKGAFTEEEITFMTEALLGDAKTRVKTLLDLVTGLESDISSLQSVYDQYDLDGGNMDSGNLNESTQPKREELKLNYDENCKPILTPKQKLLHEVIQKKALLSETLSDLASAQTYLNGRRQFLQTHYRSLA